ncbi:hypothetical protein AB0C06_25215 [Micromonospora inaquosa]|jgi:hypothetical protein|uniref:Uncharacterized protein n=1 Tax=Micromonospora inaquosa TaxID=2203716 RepID=A0A3N9WKQ3_9ACTN|nr:hypothetical protein [Micromonospora inaquosa]RQX01239.1 hypothetical protein DLJ59_19100 [Micromonospora inaquosa]
MARRTGRPSYQLDKADVRRRRTVRYAAVAGVIALVTGVLGGLVGYQVGRPDATEATIASIKQAEAKRDAQQITELIGTARRVRDQVAPVLAAIKAETTGGRAPDAAKARQWQEVMRQAAEPFADPPSGTTATNVARGGLRGAVQQASLAVDAYALAAAVPAAQRAALLDVTARQAAEAATIWSVAATQLDQISVDAGQGHQHVFLDTDPDGGALTPDGAAEGTGG